MAAGCPIVATDVPGCRDLVTDDATGLLVPYNDTKALAGAMIGLLRDRELATRLGQRASEVAGSEWNIERTWEGYASIYASVLVRRIG
jgi:glycosyltransferase involved in cell wall biosynthesis